MDHHQYRRRGGAGEGTWSGRRVSGAAYRRDVRVHELLPAEDRRRVDAGKLSDGDGGRRTLRRDDFALHARRAQCPELGQVRLKPDTTYVPPGKLYVPPGKFRRAT